MIMAFKSINSILLCIAIIIISGCRDNQKNDNEQRLEIIKQQKPLKYYLLTLPFSNPVEEMNEKQIKQLNRLILNLTVQKLNGNYAGLTEFVVMLHYDKFDIYINFANKGWRFLTTDTKTKEGFSGFHSRAWLKYERDDVCQYIFMDILKTKINTACQGTDARK